MNLDAAESTCAYYNDNWETYPDDYKEFLKHYFLAQIDGYEKGDNGKDFYRVRVGPFKKIDETKEIYNFLINSGMEGTKIFVE